MKIPVWEKIVVAIADPWRKEQAALGKAAAIAVRCGAEITLLNTFMLPQPTPDTVLGLNKRNIKLAIKDRQSMLERLASPLRRRGISVHTAVEWDFPIQDAIVRYVLKHKPDLLIAESHRHTRIARWFLNNIDWDLIRDCPCTLWFVRSATLPRTPRVLVAVDPQHAHDKPAHLDTRLLTAAQGLVNAVGGSLALAHAYETPLTAAPGTFMEPLRIPIDAGKARALVTAIKKAVNRLGTQHDIAATARYVLEGEASQVLIRLTQKYRTDVLVMGAVSRRLLQRPFIGNTAEKVIDAIDCELLVVKPAAFKCRVPTRQAKL